MPLNNLTTIEMGKCFELGITKSQAFEATSGSTSIARTIVIPHLRRAVEFWEELERKNVSERS
jgi:hypothetical protein